MDSRVVSAIDHADELWISLLKSYPFLVDKPEVLEKRKQLKRREVVISAFGRHNCGKSTILNTLLGNSCLPTDYDNETGIEVKIRHDDRVHPGPCEDDCRVSFVKKGKNCPRLVLEVEGVKGSIMARGSDDICELLHDENHTRRQTGMIRNGDDLVKNYILYAYVPILKATVEGWTLALVDTPGFGEANVKHVTALADKLFSTSTAYLYIMDSANMRDELDTRKIQQLFKHDKDLFKDGRFVVAITKYDNRFSQETRRQESRRGNRSGRQNPEPVDVANSLKTLQKQTQDFIAQSVDSEAQPPSEDAIIPVSAYWANTARWLRPDPTNEEEKAQAQKILDIYPDAQPQGQGEAVMSGLDMAASVERISGILSLEKRLRSMIEQCIHIWRTSLVKSYTGYLEEAKTELERHREEKIEEREHVKRMLDLHAKYEAKKVELIGEMSVEVGEKTHIEVQLEKKYLEIDAEAAKRLLHGRINEMMDGFIASMKGEVEHFKPDTFEQKMKIFIEKKAEKGLSEEQLNIKLEGVMIVFRNSLGQIEDLDREIEQIALSVVPEDWSPAHDKLLEERKKKYETDILSDEVLQRKQLTLKDLQKRTRAPPLRISYFQRFLDRIKKLFGRDVPPDTERLYPKWTKEMDDVMEDLKTSLKTQIDEYITDTLQKWVICEVLSIAYRNRVESRAKALLGTYDVAVKEAESKLESQHQCATDDYIASLDQNLQKINTTQQNLET